MNEFTFGLAEEEKGLMPYRRNLTPQSTLLGRSLDGEVFHRAGEQGDVRPLFRREGFLKWFMVRSWSLSGRRAARSEYISISFRTLDHFRNERRCLL